MTRRIASLLLCLFAAQLPLSPCIAGELLVAVAANFAVTARDIGEQFARQSGHQVEFSIGSTGKLYAQITQGAPFDVLLAADQERPRKLQETGHAVAGTQFGYALGRLLLWSPQPDLIDEDPAAVIRNPGLRRLAIANPALAPYGRAARQALEALDAWNDLGGRIVFGENVAQAFAMAASGNAELALVAASQATNGSGSSWRIPAELYDPVRQDAVLLTHGADNPAALEFLRFIRSATARNLIRAAGYGVEQQL